jgi:hypothetical protein
MTDFTAPAVPFLASIMTDTCEISRDEENKKDDVLDEVTGKLVKPTIDSYAVYDGPCVMSSVLSKDFAFTEGEQQKFRTGYRILLPYTVNDLRIGDTFVLTDTTNHKNDFMLGKELRVAEIKGGTHAPYRRLLVEDVSEDIGTHHA